MIDSLTITLLGLQNKNIAIYTHANVPYWRKDTQGYNYWISLLYLQTQYGSLPLHPLVVHIRSELPTMLYPSLQEMLATLPGIKGESYSTHPLETENSRQSWSWPKSTCMRWHNHYIIHTHIPHEHTNQWISICTHIPHEHTNQ